MSPPLLLPPYSPSQIYSPYYFYPLPALPQLPPTAFDLGSDENFSPTPSPPPTGKDAATDLPEPAFYAAKFARARVQMNMCYFLGRDIAFSHVPCNSNWNTPNKPIEGIKNYINELTLQTNRLIGMNNIQLNWKNPYKRNDFNERYPKNPSYDVYSVVNDGCDVVVFLVFNQYENCDNFTTTGHKYGGLTKGAMCEAHQGTGYAVVVDQGFLKEVWVGPQLLAHHLLMMLTSDLTDESKHCPEKESLLYPKLYPGKQRVDRCVADKLNRSNISKRDCLRD